MFSYRRPFTHRALDNRTTFWIGCERDSQRRDSVVCVSEKADRGLHLSFGRLVHPQSASISAYSLSSLPNDEISFIEVREATIDACLVTDEQYKYASAYSRGSLHGNRATIRKTVDLNDIIRASASVISHTEQHNNNNLVLCTSVSAIPPLPSSIRR